MTPKRIDGGVVYRRLRTMRRLLDELDKLGDLTQRQLADDLATSLVVERILTLLVDMAVSINTHVAAAAAGVAPENYRASFLSAARSGLITEDLAKELQPSAGLRNVLIHEYLEVDYEKVLIAVPAARVGYRAYVRQVAQFLGQQ